LKLRRKAYLREYSGNTRWYWLGINDKRPSMRAFLRTGRDSNTSRTIGTVTGRNPNRQKRLTNDKRPSMRAFLRTGRDSNTSRTIGTVTGRNPNRQKRLTNDKRPSMRAFLRTGRDSNTSRTIGTVTGRNPNRQERLTNDKRPSMRAFLRTGRNLNQNHKILKINYLKGIVFPGNRPGNLLSENWRAWVRFMCFAVIQR
jgi:hypothetical protein